MLNIISLMHDHFGDHLGSQEGGNLQLHAVWQMLQPKPSQ
jgi:hypothetical protein